MAEPDAPARRHRRRSRRERRQARRQQALVLGLALLTALVLMALAVPRTVALVEMMPAERTLARMRQQLPVERAAVDAAIEAGIAASTWHASGALWQQVAVAHLGRLKFAGDDREAQQHALLQAEGALQQALARQPGDAVGWWRLAWVASMLNRPPERVGAALHLSVVTGSRHALLLFPRLQLALAQWDRMGEAARQAFKPQLVWAMTADPQAFITLVRRSLAEDEVRAALRGEAELLDDYQSLLDRSRPLPGARQG
jgi:hypothetical protein